RTACFSPGWSYSDTAEKGMQRDFHFVVRIERLKRSGIAGVIDRIEPDFLRQRRVDHRRVIRGVQRTKSGAECAKSLVTVDLQVQKFHDERVAGLRSIDEERAGERVVALDHRECVAGLFDGVAKAIERVGIED